MLLILKILDLFFLIKTNIYIKLFFYLSASLAIIYQLLNLYFLQKFINNKDFIIPEVLPEFVKNWLCNIKIISFNSNAIKDLKNSWYFHMLIYLIIINIIIIIIIK